MKKILLLIFISFGLFCKTETLDSIKVILNEVFSISIEGEDWVFEGEKDNKSSYRFVDSKKGDGYVIFSFVVLKKDVYYFSFVRQDLQKGETQRRTIRILSGDFQSHYLKSSPQKDKPEPKKELPKPETQKNKVKKTEKESNKLYKNESIEEKIKDYYSLKPDEMIKKLEELVKLIPFYDKLDKILFDIAEYYEKNNQINKAIDYYKKIISRFPLGDYEKKSLGKLYYYNKFYYIY